MACLQTDEQVERPHCLSEYLFSRGFWLYRTTSLSLLCDLHQYLTHPVSRCVITVGNGGGGHVFSESYRFTAPVSGQSDCKWKDEYRYYTGLTWFRILKALRWHYWLKTVNWNCIISVLRDYRQWYPWPPTGLLMGIALSQIRQAEGETRMELVLKTLSLSLCPCVRVCAPPQMISYMLRSLCLQLRLIFIP